MKLCIMCQCKYILLFLKLFLFICVSGVRWDNAADLNEDFRLLWTIEGLSVTFEVQVRTLGYIGLGFSLNGELPGSDMAIGWVSQNQAYFQDRHVKKTGGDMEPVVDPSQDYVLLHGSENATHTVMRFKRKLDTCDTSYDIPISNDTMRIVFMYHESEPQRGLLLPGNLPDPKIAFKGYRSLFLIQKPNNQQETSEPHVQTIELRNQDVELPQGDDTLHWCKMFKLQDISEKSHVIKYEPVFDSESSIPYMQHIILYECQAASPELELMSREQGRPCFKPNSPPLSCNAIVATWAKGSEGFTFPLEAGYALDSNQARFYLMETHYNNPRNAIGDTSKQITRQKADSSGLKLYYTNKLRTYDAGVLSIGLDPNWRHIIPPFQRRVVSEGHCIEDCTRKAFPKQGVSIFAVMMRTHLIGKEIRLRHIRGNEEFSPIAHDSNVDPNYQEYRRLPTPVQTLPGDRLISECTYDSSNRDQITLGGLTTREESCTILTYYYPRQIRLTTCHSLPSLPTVLHSLGIQELAVGSNPVLIASPPDLAGMTLESRLVTYDWKNQFDSFQQVTRRGSFKAICWDAKNSLIPGTQYIEGHNPNLTKIWRSPVSPCIKSNTKLTSNLLRKVTGQASGLDAELPLTIHEDSDDEINNIIEGAARSKVSRSSATETMGLSGAPNLFGYAHWSRWSLLLNAVILSVFTLKYCTL